MEQVVKIFEDPKTLAESFSEEFKKICDKVISENDKINIALSGGSTPKTFLEILAKDYKHKIDWSKINLFWVDERCVPADDSESNFGMTKKTLLDHLSIPENNVHRVHGESEPGEEAKRYSEVIKSNVKNANGFPEFDLILLGMGDDGHTASIFPDQMNLLNSENVCEVAVKPDSTQKRITLTGKVINNAARIYFLVTGKSKSEVVSEILGKKNNYLSYPAAEINNRTGELIWYLDKDSASGLE